jgi:hypothetical protein
MVGRRANPRPSSTFIPRPANAVRYALALALRRPETSPSTVAVEDLVACAKLSHYDHALVGPIVGELSAIQLGTDQMPVLDSKLTQFEAKAKATGKKAVNVCVDVQLR